MATSSEPQSAGASGKGRIALAVLASVVLIIVGMGLLTWAGTGSASYKACKAKPAEAQQDQNQSNAPNNKPDDTVEAFIRCEGAFLSENEGVVTAFATIVIAAFTITLGIATLILADETKTMRRLAVEEGKRTKEALVVARDGIRFASAQAKTAVEALVTNSRAWVFTQPWPEAIEFSPDSQDIFIHKMELRSYGNTPARVYELYVGFSDKEPGGDVATYPGEPIRQVYNLGPNNQWWHREKFETTDVRPFVYGYVKYTDIWGEKRESRFCYRLTRYTPAIKFPFRTAGSTIWSWFN